MAVSLLDDARDTLLVWPEVAGTDADGNPVFTPAADPVSVSGRMDPVTADEDATTGQAVITTYRFLSRTFPGGPFARVQWEGRTWDVVGEPQRRRGSEATRHVVVLLRSRDPEVP